MARVIIRAVGIEKEKYRLGYTKVNITTDHAGFFFVHRFSRFFRSACFAVAIWFSSENKLKKALDGEFH